MHPTPYLFFEGDCFEAMTLYAEAREHSAKRRAEGLEPPRKLVALPVYREVPQPVATAPARPTAGHLDYSPARPKVRDTAARDTPASSATSLALMRCCIGDLPYAGPCIPARQPKLAHQRQSNCLRLE